MVLITKTEHVTKKNVGTLEVRILHLKNKIRTEISLRRFLNFNCSIIKLLFIDKLLLIQQKFFFC